MRNNVAPFLRLMLIADGALAAGRDLVELALAGERGGVTSVQLRVKYVSPRRQIGLARALVRALRVPVLVNDRPDIALAAGAAGVHLGPDDLPVWLARRIVPPDFLIGASVNSEGEIGLADGADYCGVGPWRATGTKADAGEALGADGFARAVRAAGGRPCIAIGGLRPDDLPAVFVGGGVGVAVGAGIMSAGDPEAAARLFDRWWPGGSAPTVPD